MTHPPTICPACGRAHVWLRINCTIVCECGYHISRTEQLLQRDEQNA